MNTIKNIGDRLRNARLIMGLSQQEFADKVGINRVTLASYEVGRYPLPAEVGLRICRVLKISEKWLADGDEPLHQAERFSAFSGAGEHVDKIPFGMPYHEAFKKFLERHYWTIVGSAICLLLLLASPAKGQQLVQVFIPTNAASTPLNFSAPARQAYPTFYPAENYPFTAQPGSNAWVLNPGTWTATFGNGASYLFTVPTSPVWPATGSTNNWLDLITNSAPVAIGGIVFPSILVSNANGVTTFISGAGLAQTGGTISGNGGGLFNLPFPMLPAGGSALISSAPEYFALGDFGFFSTVETNASFYVSNAITIHGLIVKTNTGLGLGSNFSLALGTNGNGSGAMANSGVIAYVGFGGITNTNMIAPITISNCWVDLRSSALGTGSFTPNIAVEIY